MNLSNIPAKAVRRAVTAAFGNPDHIDFRVGQWERHQLPQRMEGRSFLDVGCWEGLVCAEAVKRGASAVLGIDYCTSPDLLATMKSSDFSFIQMDVFSEKLLELPEFDVVHCAGVLYHVENPLSLVFRLRKLCKLAGLLFVETTCAADRSELPLMVFHPGSSLDDNPSNWWSPNEMCLREMFAAAGFTDLEVTYRLSPKASAEFSIGRITLRGTASNTPATISPKVLPRRPKFMPSGEGHGNRHGVKP